MDVPAPFDAPPIEYDEIRVLHVDDNPNFGDLVERHFERLGDDVVVFRETDPVSGLDRLEAEHVDCIISDYQMPAMNGIEFLRAVREMYPNLPFILFTGKGSEEVASDAINAGVTAYFQKGGSETFELLLTQVENAVGRHRSERLAQITKDRLFGLYEQADGLYTLAEDWSITYWNQRIADRTGKTPEEVIGRSYWDVFPAARELKTAEYFREAMETRDAQRFDIHYEPADYWADVCVYPIAEGLFVHSREITEIKEREREIERRNRILESFASTVSHDIRNPLNVAQSRLELTQATGDLEHLEEVAMAHNRMQNLITDLLRIGRGDEEGLTTVSVRDSAQTAWETIPSGAMSLDVDVDCEFEAYESQIRQLYENLFWNALEHGNAETVRVGALDDGFYVEDDGPGIPAEDCDRIFEAGYSSKDGNPGYGLHLVENIAEFHGWDIEVSTGTDGGARFEVSGIQRPGA